MVAESTAEVEVGEDSGDALAVAGSDDSSGTGEISADDADS